jgi:hypothetical protein
MTVAQTGAESALRMMLPASVDTAATIELACHTAFLVRDREPLADLDAVVRTDPEAAAGLIVALAAMVDVDKRPRDLLAWIGNTAALQQGTVLAVGALAEARKEYDDVGADTLPPVTLESMRQMAHVARLTGARQPCGTIAAHRRHVRAGHQPCLRCQQARELYDSATPEQRKLIRHPPATTATQARPSCGSPAGYVAHLAATPKEDPCDPCRAARKAYDAGRYLERGPRRKAQREAAQAAQPVALPIRIVADCRGEARQDAA